jgi:chemotaxis protein CheD
VARPQSPTAEERVRVGIAEYAVAEAGTAVVTSGLGSCVGVAVYSPRASVGGLAHVMLPSAEEGSGGPDAKYADTGVAALVEAVTDAGAPARDLRAKLAGGSDMLDLGGDDGPIGERNVAAIREALATDDVPVEATDVGGDSGRTLVFHPGTGELEVRGPAGTERI